MKHIYKRLSANEHLTHFLIPETIAEKSIGMRAFQWMSNHTVLLFKSPCILHTIGLSRSIDMKKYSATLNPSEETVRVDPNTIVFCLKLNTWVGESLASTHDDLHEQGRKAGNNLRKQINRISLKRRFVFLAALFAIGMPFFRDLAEAKSTLSAIKMQVGTSKEVSLQHAPRNLNISNPDVIDVQRIGLSNKILVTALSSGESSLTAQYPNNKENRWNFLVGSAAGQDLNFDRLSSASLIRMAKDLQKRTGLEVTIDDGAISVFGHLSNPTQSKALIEICLGLAECKPRYSISDTALLQIIESVLSHIDNLEIKNIQLIPSFGGVIVKGTVPSEVEKRQLTTLLRSVVPKPFDQLMIEKANQSLIETQLSFFRVSETGLTAMGITATPDNQTQSEGALATISVSSSSAKLKGGPLLNLALPSIVLKAMSKKGVIKQIAQPSIVVASGGRGEITSGGELLFQSGGQVQKFLTQNYGITVALQPKLIGKSKIVQRVDLKITHPQADPSQNAVSSLATSSLTTEVSSSSEEQILLARISQQASGKRVTKIPVIGHIPIIGELFKTREITGEDAELWITLKSQLVPSGAPQLEPFRESGEIDPNFSLLD